MTAPAASPPPGAGDRPTGDPRPTAPGTPPTGGEDEVVDLCRELIRFDTSNTGDLATSRPERPAAEWVAQRLAEAGIDAQLRESVPGRASLVARIAGTDPSRDALLVHGHLDVVPADPAEWSVPPFAGELRDGYLWGRGAVDMKDFDAMVLAVVRGWARTGYRPPRDIVLAFTADEEAGSTYGARFLVEQHAELLDGCTEAIGEVGGYSFSVSDALRIYPVQIAEKGIDWLRITATGTAGHGSMLHEDNPVTALAEAVARLGRHRFPVELTPAVRQCLEQISGVLGVGFDPDAPEELVAKLGPVSRMLGATLRNTANPTRLAAGYKENVIPGNAWATVDCRTLPGRSEQFLAQVREIIGPELELAHVSRQPAVETSFDGPLVEAMVAAIRAEDPAGHPVPYMLSGGTDAKAFHKLGIRCFGFSPLRLPAGLDFASLFHGVDERVPVEGLRFGVRTLDRFLRAS